MQPHTAAGTTGQVRSADRWEEIFYAPGHTAQTWACIAAAVEHADAAMAQAIRAAGTNADTALEHGGPVWRESAAASYQRLSDTDAYRHLDADPPGRTVADMLAARTWLTAPVAADGLESTTVSERLEVDEYFLLDDETRPARVAKLLSAAQAVGVLRTDGARVELWHTVDDDGDLDGHRVAVCRDDGVILASPPLAIDEIADDTLTGIDAALDVLRQTAVLATEVITIAARAEAAPTPTAPPLHPVPHHDPTRGVPPPVPEYVEGFRPQGRPLPPPAAGNAFAVPEPASTRGGFPSITAVRQDTGPVADIPPTGNHTVTGPATRRPTR